jgi:nucleotidyltransferase substrate binding protein (TIGR01987 family)
MNYDNYEWIYFNKPGYQTDHLHGFSMSSHDIRWIQRFNHFNKAFAQLEEAVILSQRRKLTKLEEQGLIQAFEFTHEMAWNTLKDFLEERGAAKIYGSKDATREAFAIGLIEDGETWMRMIESRNLTSHTYNEATAAEIASAVTESYCKAFSDFQVHMRTLKEERA